ncbi:hypothetical protein OF83DRAFT_409521 [Amylostereum chailletii]|nr:hypothetical protein OF83DRAFT_409521 [Amylostereum chailletii]
MRDSDDGKTGRHGLGMIKGIRVHLQTSVPCWNPPPPLPSPDMITRAFFFGFLLLSWLCSAQTPQCATVCASDVIGTVGCGSISNTTCICTQEFLGLGGACLAQLCTSATDLNNGRIFLCELCAPVSECVSTPSQGSSTNVGQTPQPSSAPASTGSSRGSSVVGNSSSQIGLSSGSTNTASAPATISPPPASSPPSTVASLPNSTGAGLTTIEPGASTTSTAASSSQSTSGSVRAVGNVDLRVCIVLCLGIVGFRVVRWV